MTRALRILAVLLAAPFILFALPFLIVALMAAWIAGLLLWAVGFEGFGPKDSQGDSE